MKKVPFTDVSATVITEKILFIRNQKVILDRDLANLYGVKTIRLREQVKRNITRFPMHFMFRLSEAEINNMVSQNAIPSKQHLGGSLPYVFTEHGILMLANVIKNEQAIQMNIRIIEIFVKLRKIIFTHKDILLKLEQIERKIVNHDEEIQLIFSYLKELITPTYPKIEPVGFKIAKNNDSNQKQSPL